jgi:hypothetical protein
MTKDVAEAQWEVYKFKIATRINKNYLFSAFIAVEIKKKLKKHVVVQLITDQSFQFD